LQIGKVEYAAPLRFGPINQLLKEKQTDWHVSLLPHGRAGVYVNGFSISRGTQYPELSYELLKYLTGVQITSLISCEGGDVAARKSLTETICSAAKPFEHMVKPEIYQKYTEGMDNAFTYSELRYTDYLWLAMNADGDVQASLEPVMNFGNNWQRRGV
jgi:hypothetical protein